MIASRSMKRRWWLLAVALAVTAVAMWAPAYAGAADTGTIAVCLSDSNGVNLTLDGDKAWYQPNGGSINYVGPVGGSGCREQTLTAGASVAVWVKYNGTYSNQQTGVVPAGSTLRFDFYTTKVTLQYDHSIAFGGPTGDAGFFTKPSMELLSDGVTPLHFRLDGTGGAPARTTLLWPVATGPGATFNRALFVARLVDHGGSPLSGGAVDYYLGGWHSNAAETDADGNAVLAIDASSPSITVRMYYLGTSIQQGPSPASVITFQTTLVNAKLVDADGVPLDTGYATYYASGWRTFGTGVPSLAGGPTSGGVISQEMLPGSYSFAMEYNHTRQQLNGVAISGATTDVVFQTGRLTAYFSQPFSWYNSQFYSFSPATQEFLPGQVGLSLAGCNTPKFPIAAGDHLVKTGIVATLADSSNHPLAGGVASAYAGGWKSVGTTGSNGKACAALDGHLGNTAVAMVYNGTRQQISQNAQTNAIYAFKTTAVTVELRNSSNALSDTGSASYYAGGWHSIGDTSGGQVHVQMLPGSYSFAMTFNGTRQQQNGVAISGATDTVTFQTTDVTVELRDSGGGLIDTGNASYYASGWHSIGDTSGGQVHVQMLPGHYSFAMTLLGTRQQLNGVAVGGSTTTVAFQTGSVHSDTGTATSYYAGGWKTFTNDMELLPGKYWFDWGSAPQAQETIVAGIVNHIQ